MEYKFLHHLGLGNVQMASLLLIILLSLSVVVVDVLVLVVGKQLAVVVQVVS